MNVLSAIKNNYGKYIAKGVGVAALSLCAYDSHVLGKIKADEYAQHQDSENAYDAFSPTQYLAKPSIVVSKMKDAVYHYSLEENVRHFFNSAIGYFEGFGSELVSNAVPFTLGVGALLTKGKWCKGFAWGTAAYGAFVFLKDGLGLGHASDLSKKF
ncbi:MAG: hypothetical protein LKG27_05315 [Clostridiaceae bacterium]|jgi:hypothetical protein|nr:hypothetical protein [Clostridiaceae bacterium]